MDLWTVSNLVFYTQSTIAVISGRICGQRKKGVDIALVKLV